MSDSTLIRSDYAPSVDRFKVAVEQYLDHNAEQGYALRVIDDRGSLVPYGRELIVDGTPLFLELEFEDLRAKIAVTDDLKKISSSTIERATGISIKDLTTEELRAIAESDKPKSETKASEQIGYAGIEAIQLQRAAKIEFWDGYNPFRPYEPYRCIGPAFEKLSRIMLSFVKPVGYMPPKPDPPKPDAPDRVFFEWYYHITEELGYKVTLKDLATEMGKSHGTVRRKYPHFKKQRKRRTEQK